MIEIIWLEVGVLDPVLVQLEEITLLCEIKPPELCEPEILEVTHLLVNHTMVLLGVV